MLRTLIPFLLTLAACGPRALPPQTGDDAPPSPAAPPAIDAGAGGSQAPGDDAPLVASALVELMVDGPEVWLQITRETGNSRVVDVGIYDGDCLRVQPGANEPALAREAAFAVDCAGDPVRRLRFVHRGDQLVMLEAKGNLDFEPTRSFDLPVGIRVKLGD